ncbi:MAG: zinc ribbon domain-containing protein [Smithella sp.]|jgi:putative FmdB family regulatory protein
MPTYEYECSNCGLQFERQQTMTDAPIKECPGCGKEVQRLVSGGSGFIMKSAGVSRRDAAKSCSLEETGKTCCGADKKCRASHCGD